MGREQYIHSRGRSRSHVEAIGTCNLELSSIFILQLGKTFYVPSFSRNLILESALVLFRISCNFSNTGFSFLIKSKVIGFGTLCDGFYYETPRKSNFLKNGKTVISVKTRNFSRSWMLKWISPLETSCEI